jgi:hypothetical protein
MAGGREQHDRDAQQIAVSRLRKRRSSRSTTAAAMPTAINGARFGRLSPVASLKRVCSLAGFLSYSDSVVSPLAADWSLGA